MNEKKMHLAFLTVMAALLLFAANASTALAYEDKYSKNGDIHRIETGEFPDGFYTLNGRMNGTTSTLTLFLVTQDVHYINMLDIYMYEFRGKLNREDKPSYGFKIEIGMPINYTTSSTIELGGQKAGIKQVQVGIYPGYYNFYNYGQNFVSYAGSSDWLVMTLGPNYKLIEEDAYWYYDTVPEDSFIEVEEGENQRVYVIVGEEEFVVAAMEDFEDWAVESEARYVKEEVVSGSHEEIEVDVPEENLDNLLASVAPDVEEPEVKKTEAPASTEAKKPAEEKDGAASQSTVIIIFIIAAAAVVVLFVGVKVLKKK